MEEKIKNFPNEILSLYIGEILIIETVLKNVIKNSKVSDPLTVEKSKIKKDVVKYHHPLHVHAQCMCKGCCIWSSDCRKCYRKEPLNRYNLHKQGIYTLEKNDKVYYSARHIYPEDSLDDLPFIDISGDITIENCKNNIEKKIVELLLREKDPIFIEKHYTDWFSLLIKDRLPFTDDTVIVYNVQDILVYAQGYKKSLKFALRSYKGNFTYFHVRLIRKNLLSIKNNEKHSFHLGGGNSVELDAKIDQGNLIIIILDCY
jgi:hypothetical protein